MSKTIKAQQLAYSLNPNTADSQDKNAQWIWLAVIYYNDYIEIEPSSSCWREEDNIQHGRATIRNVSGPIQNPELVINYEAYFTIQKKDLLD